MNFLRVFLFSLCHIYATFLGFRLKNHFHLPLLCFEISIWKFTFENKVSFLRQDNHSIWNLKNRRLLLRSHLIKSGGLYFNSNICHLFILLSFVWHQIFLTETYLLEPSLSKSTAPICQKSCRNLWRILSVKHPEWLIFNSTRTSYMRWNAMGGSKWRGIYTLKSCSWWINHFDTLE